MHTLTLLDHGVVGLGLLAGPADSFSFLQYGSSEEVLWQVFINITPRAVCVVEIELLDNCHSGDKKLPHAGVYPERRCMAGWNFRNYGM